MLQRHIEERHDALLAARIALRNAELRREIPPPTSHERPETREVETQTEKASGTVNTRPNETQTDPCTKLTKSDTENANDKENKPSTSGSVISDLGMPGPSNRSSETENNANKPTENVDEQAESSPEELIVENVNEQQAVIQPNPIAEPPNREANGHERRQRLIIIHQRRNDEDENVGNRAPR